MNEKRTIGKLLIAVCLTMLMVVPGTALSIAAQSTESTVASLPRTTSISPSFNPPSSFDLRNDDGHDYVTSVKDQTGGTCWTHGTMAALEGNLLITGNWNVTGHSEEPNLAEYHLDWWNGFNTYNNSDSQGSGLPVHEGGDYLIASAYITRGDGAVYCAAANDNTEEDAAWYYNIPEYHNSTYEIFYPNDIEWFIAGTNLSNIDTIKETLMTNGVMGTCIDYENNYIHSYGSYYAFYQPPSSQTPPNHAVAIVGWDDAKVTPAPLPGAWICKNSWGSGWGPEGGYFWVSYYDRWCGQNPEMGAVSFQDVQLHPYDHTYYYDYHGWRDTLTDISEAFNAFTAQGNETLQAVSFYTATDGVGYEAKVYGRFEGGALQNELASASGTIDYKGYHTVTLAHPVSLTAGDPFYIYVKLLAGGQAIDRTSIVSTLLAVKDRGTEVKSVAHAGESYYWAGSSWADLYEYDFHNESRNQTANFCIKGLTTGGSTPRNPDLSTEGGLSWTGIKPGATAHGNFIVENIGDPMSLLDWRIETWPSWGTWTFQPQNGTGLTPEDGAFTVQVTVVAPSQRSEFNGTVKIVNIHDPNDFALIPVYMKTPLVVPPTALQLLWQFLQERLHLLVNHFFNR
ncbi:MAG TPA: lectin like domain-containing protein [Candidatus Thermoplasmatota archaeon]|nr:lectin like domain-containing protein [Candidatus Thermoplasmatota archaeon]